MAAMMACWAGRAGEPGNGIAPKAADQTDPSAALFDTRRLLEVRIELAPADWDKLRREHHDLLAALGTNRFDQPEPNPYHVYRAKVTIDGQTVADVGLRKRGFIGSSSMQRPSLGIRFDHYDKQRQFAGLRRLALNNNLQDPSQLHQVLAYRLFAAAGVPAPRCNLARVTVNGDYLGIYSHVEAIEDEFLRRHFGDASGNLYEGQISDFRPRWVKTFQRKNHKDNPDLGDLDRLVKALQNDDARLLAAVESVVDLEAYLTYWAMESLIGHWDSYSNGGNNFFVYANPATKKFSFIPWGADSVLGAPDPFTRGTTPESVKARMLLPWRLYQIPQVRERYREKLRALLRDVWQEEELLAEADRLQAMVRPHLSAPPRQFNQSLIRLRQFIRSRRETLAKDLAGPAPELTQPLKLAACLENAGAFRALFVTTWQENFELSKATPVNMTLKLKDGLTKNIGLGRVAVARSRDQRNPDSPTLGFLGSQLWDGKFQLVLLVIQPDLFKPGATLNVDGFEVGGLLLEISFMGADGHFLGFLRGKLTLDKASQEVGETVSGKIEADIYQFQP
jgi:spore coat protein CotH